MTTSLIKPDDPQLPGFDQDTREILEGKPEAGVFTAEKLFTGNPRIYKAAVNLLARDASIKEVARILEMSTNTVMAIKRREAGHIDTLKQGLSRDFVEVAQLAAQTARDRLLDDKEAAKVGFKDLMIGAAVATDKAMLLAGEPTAITETRQQVDPDDFDRLMALARLKVIDVTPVDTGIEGGSAGAKGPAAGAVHGPGEPAAVALDAGAGDVRHSENHIPADIESVGDDDICPIIEAEMPLDMTSDGTGPHSGGDRQADPGAGLGATAGRVDEQGIGGEGVGPSAA